jgi:CHAT domain
MHEYEELKIRIEPDSAGGFTTYADGPSGSAPGSFRLPIPEEELKARVEALGRRVRAAPTHSPAVEFGQLLFDALFQDQIRGIYHESLAQAQAQGKGLRITLGLTRVPGLMQLPWEFLYHDDDFLAISDWTPVVRYLDLPTARPPLAMEPPLRILAMVSAPTDVVRLDVDREKSIVERALRKLVDAGAVEIMWLEKATLEELQGTLRHAEYHGEFHVFHFIGHGAFDPRQNDGLLLLEDERGRASYTGGKSLGRTLKNHTSLRLAVLNSCEGGRAADDDPFAGVASSLVRAQIPAVLAMQFEITDRAAAIFAGGFYGSLADGYPVDTALSQARLAIMNDQNPLEWGTPILLMRVKDGRLFDVSAPIQTPSPISDDLPARPPPGQPPPPRRPSRRERLAAWLSARRLPAAAAGALLLALVGVGVYLLVTDGGGDDDFVATVMGDEGPQEMRAAVALSGGSAVSVGRNGPDPAVWTYAAGEWARRDLAGESALMNGVAARGGVVVAVGSKPGDDEDARIWKESRTRRWTVVSCTGCTGAGDQRASGVAFRKDGSVVAVGRRTGSSDDKYDAAVWISEDGDEWRAVDLDNPELGGSDSQVMNAVVEIEGRLVAVGRDGPDGAVWISEDGESWRKVRDPRLRSPVEFLEMHGIARVGTRLIAVGWKYVPGRPNVASPWISFDRGRSWLPGTSADFGPRGQKMLGVVELRRQPSETVAVGYDHRGDQSVAAAWSSLDGQQWVPVESSSFAVGDRAEMNGIVVLSDGMVVGVGETGPEGDADAAVWRSTADS